MTFIRPIPGPLVVEAVPAYNLEPLFLWLVAHPKSDQNVGYVLEVAGKRIYHSGDTAHVPELDALRDLDLALVAVGGQPPDSMDAAAAAALVHAIKPKLAVPMHYPLGKGIAEDFARQVGPDVHVELAR
jgi:L-ascorbate metabolism protein UlaG (beta-lactamase superfamily)